jgi:hypothetical protein
MNSTFRKRIVHEKIRFNIKCCGGWYKHPVNIIYTGKYLISLPYVWDHRFPYVSYKSQYGFALTVMGKLSNKLNCSIPNEL